MREHRITDWLRVWGSERRHRSCRWQRWPKQLRYTVNDSLHCRLWKTFLAERRRGAKRQPARHTGCFSFCRQRLQRQFLRFLRNGCKHEQHVLLRFERSLSGFSGRGGNVRVNANLRWHHGIGQPEDRPAPGQCELRPIPSGGEEWRELCVELGYGSHCQRFFVHLL